jgi:hypothetical protein
MPDDGPGRGRQEDASAMARLEDETAAYNDRLTAERQDDINWAEVAKQAARKLLFDD